ncbi:hypothetical protein XENOCAPTIV_006001 [Xenoophorus captivus]|uniref:TNFR-Cys domain-containing protein n=1 Tax=Xenoophorus captivus TaxID=1517983 RepID=A0ABV0QQ80_9TELE
MLKCEKCPPGSHMTAQCTATTPTKCKPCQRSHFTELHNYLPRCLYCNIFCTQNQEVESECSPVNNRVCRCKAGFYMIDDFCVRHSECGPGHGVQTIGTRTEDTVCEKCSKGYFSSSSSALDLCVKHQDCSSGNVMLLHGSAFYDKVCGTCDNFANGGDDLRAVLSALFSGNRIQKRDLKRFVHRILHKNGDECNGDSALPKRKGPLVDQIIAWLAQASAEQLKELPKILRLPQFSSIGNRLDSILNEIKQQNPGCSL